MSGSGRGLGKPTVVMRQGGSFLLYELQAYTTPYLRELDYEIHVLDFRDPLKSCRFNFLQRIIDLVAQNNIPRAVEATWDMTSLLVSESKSGERIWSDGEKSIMAAAILSVVIENMDNPQFQNMANVYSFIAKMCQYVGNDLPLNRFVKSLPESHPARQLIGISEVAPSKTRGSFFTGALATLNIFTSPLIGDMTSKSDFSPAELGSKKQAVFLVLPDDRTTYYSVAALFIAQLYEALVDEAVKRGDKLERKVNFMLDEFGNFAAIPGMTAKISAAASRGMRFNLFLQSLTQLDEKYGREVAQTLLGNCETWIFLSANDTNTLEAISKRLGTYTVATTSQSSSYNTANMGSGNSSHSTNLHSRALLTADEIGRIARPYTLVLHGNNPPAILHSPDLSKWYFNKLFGMGDIEHNRKLRAKRDAQRPSREEKVIVPLWDIWKRYYPQDYAHRATQIMKERIDDE